MEEALQASDWFEKYWGHIDMGVQLGLKPAGDAGIYIVLTWPLHVCLLL